ncbi:MAG TPA: hypothetical protein VIY09_03690 [Rhizomicrobium sp.]
MSPNEELFTQCLHLKWGEALYYVKQTDDARKQIAAASNRAFSVADKSELSRWIGHR